jgi:hypothetical protein
MFFSKMIISFKPEDLNLEYLAVIQHMLHCILSGLNTIKSKRIN